MRILHVDPATTWRGGERQVFYLARELARRGHECVVVASPGSPLEAECAGAGLMTRPLAIRGDLDLAAIARLARVIGRDRPDVLHLHTARAHAAGGLAARLMKFHPVVVTRRLELPVRGPFSRWKYHALADHFIAISGEVARSLESAGIPAGRISRIASGIEVPPREQPQRQRSRPAVGTLAAFTEQKDPPSWISTAIQVCREREDVDFLWWGEGPQREPLQEIVRRENLGTRIQLPGFQQDLADFWRRIDVFFLPSRFEALGTSILDAMAREIPVIVSRVGGIPEIVRQDVEGILVPPGNVEGFRDAITALLDDPERAQRLGAAGRARVAEFEIGGIVARIEALYEELLRLRSRPRREAIAR